jgi:hypothetical protein
MPLTLTLDADSAHVLLNALIRALDECEMTIAEMDTDGECEFAIPHLRVLIADVERKLNVK